MVLKPCQSWDKLPTSTGAGLNYILPINCINCQSWDKLPINCLSTGHQQYDKVPMVGSQLFVPKVFYSTVFSGKHCRQIAPSMDTNLANSACKYKQMDDMKLGIIRM